MPAPTYPDDRLERSRFFDGPTPRTPEREREVAALASLVDRGDLFAERELAPVAGASSYRLRGSGREFVLRHGTQDVAILDEVFRKRLYEPPPAVQDALAESARPLTVVDAGANIGLFSLFIAERLAPQAVIAFEPDRSNFELLEACATRNGNDVRWHLVPACAGTHDGSIRFRAGLFASSRMADGTPTDGETVVTPMVDFFPYLEDADLVKIDIEGGEWALLSDPRLASVGVRAIALEYHFHLSPPGAAPGRVAERLLHRAGFATEVLHERPDGQGMLWAWKDTSVSRSRTKRDERPGTNPA